MPHRDLPRDGDESGLSSVLVVLGALAIAILMRLVAPGLGVDSWIATILPFLAAGAAIAGAAAAGTWHPPWLGDLSKTATWVTLRAIILIFAIVTIAGIATRPVKSGCPPTYTGDIGRPGGALLHSKLVGNMLVCTYDYQGGL